MQAPCPKCQTPTLLVPGGQALCGECGHSWMSGAEAQALTWELELQRAPGDVVQGPFDRLALRQMLYVGHLTGSELVRVPGATRFRPLRDVPELLEVLRLMDKAEPPKAAPVGERRITGWKASAEVVQDKPPISAVVPDAPVEKAPTKPFPMALVLGGIVVSLLIVAAALVGVMLAFG